VNRIVVLILVICSLKASSQVDETLRVADSLYALGDYSKAIQSYEQGELSEKGLINIARAYDALGNKVKSLEYYDILISKYETGSIIQYEYAKLLANTQANEKADSIFKLLIIQHPSNPNYYYQSGLLFEKRQDSIANDLFLQAFKIDTTHLNATYKIARYRLSKRKFKEAKYYINIGLKNNPISSRFINLSALRLYYTKDYHGAIAAYALLLEQQISNVQMHEHLAFSYGKTNQYEKAIEQFTILINQYDDENPSYHYNLGKSFMVLSRFEKGRSHVEIAIALQELPIDAEYMTLATSYNRLGKYGKTMKFLRRALEENPKNEHALYQLAVAADNFYEEKQFAIPFYENYIKSYLKDGRYLELAQSRLSDIEKELHFNKD